MTGSQIRLPMHCSCSTSSLFGRAPPVISEIFVVPAAQSVDTTLETANIGGERSKYEYLQTYTFDFVDFDGSAPRSMGAGESLYRRR